MVRSAFAELYARHLGSPLPVASAATRYRNDHLMAETACALESRGVPREWARSFRPRHVADILDDLDPATLVLGMARMHLDALARRAELRRRAFLLALVRGEAREIEDPVLDGADFERTFARVAGCVETLVERLRARRDQSSP